MTSDMPHSEFGKCSKAGGACSTGERCGLWIHNGDDRVQCVNEYQCNTWGRHATKDTTSRDREWFYIACRADGDNDWVNRAYEIYQNDVPMQAQQIQD